MAKQEAIQMDGVVTETLPNTTFRVELFTNTVCDSSSSMTAQWAAVTTTEGEIRVPEQKPDPAPARRIIR